MAQNGFDGKRCFLTGAASGIGRATALKLAAQGAELYLTDRDAEGLATTVADALALGAKVPEHRALDISDYDAVAAFAADIHANHPAMDVVMNIAGVSAWGTVDRLTHEHWKSMIDINLMGPIHVIEAFVPPMIAARPRRPSGQRVLGRRPGRTAVARRLQRQQVRAARTVRGAALRPGPATHRCVGGGARRGENPTGADGSDRRRRPRASRTCRSGPTGSPATRCRPNTSPTGSCAASPRTGILIYTSPDIRALYMFKRAAWWPYSVAMRQANVVFTRALRPGLK